MHKAETQQFAKFFLKDLTTKNPDCNKQKSYPEKSNISQSS